MASFRGTAIYCTPNEAKKVSTYPNMVATATIDREAAVAIREYYNSKEAHVTTAAGMLAGLALAPFAPVIGILITPTTGFLTYLFTELLETRDDIFDALAVNSSGIEEWTIDVEYHYSRHGSNDGAWFLSDASVS